MHTTAGRRAHDRGADGHTISDAQIAALFDGFDLLEPGLVWTPSWRPESPDDLYADRPEVSGYYAGVGRKP